MDLNQAISIFVGENGSGKSTLLEAIAKAADMIVVGSDDIKRDKTLNPVEPLVNTMRLVWNKRIRRGFFLRAEDFFGYVKRIRALQDELAGELHRIDKEYEGRSDYAKALASQPAAGSLNAMAANYGSDLDANSHGESFLTLFQSRFVPGGLYILDEPEAALSPISQLGLIAMITEMTKRDAQFIIATHSPILMALPDACVYDFDRNPPTIVDYDDLEHVKFYRSFLADPELFLSRL
ncbi:AAA family ATPase [bacterium]|nr:AAA family ATPase [bacterium]